jgi:hypothetical protein
MPQADMLDTRYSLYLRLVEYIIELRLRNVHMSVQSEASAEAQKEYILHEMLLE